MSKSYVEILNDANLPLQFLVGEPIYLKNNFFDEIEEIEVDANNQILVYTSHSTVQHVLTDEFKFADHYGNTLAFNKFVKYAKKLINLKKSHEFDSQEEMNTMIDYRIRLAKIDNLDNLKVVFKGNPYPDFYYYFTTTLWDYPHKVEYVEYYDTKIDSSVKTKLKVEFDLTSEIDND